MSIVSSLISLIEEEMIKAKATRLISVRMKYGALSHVVPESLATAYEILTLGTALEGSRLDLTEELPVLACGSCGKEYSPPNKKNLFMPCPACGNSSGNDVLSGKGVYLDQMEVEDT